MFKNEFKTNDILRLWDVVFSQHNTGHFEIFIGTSIILMHKEQVFSYSLSPNFELKFKIVFSAPSEILSR